MVGKIAKREILYERIIICVQSSFITHWRFPPKKLIQAIVIQGWPVSIINIDVCVFVCVWMCLLRSFYQHPLISVEAVFGRQSRPLSITSSIQRIQVAD